MSDTVFKILLVEDDQLDQMAFRRMVEHEKLPYDCTIVGSLSEARKSLDGREFDVIISDYSLGDGTALDVLGLAKDTPVILVTGADDRETAVKVWRAGAYDYLTKDVEREYLKTIRITIENAIKQSELKKALERKRRNQTAIFDAVPVYMLLIEENLTVLRVNRAVKEMLGREYLEIIGRLPGNALGCANSVANEKKECGCSRGCNICALRKSVKEVFASGKAVHGAEIPLVLIVGDKQTAVWFSVSAELVNIDNKRCAVVAMDDITSRKNAEEMLRKSDERFQLVARATNDAVWDWDLLTNKLWWSDAFQILFGWLPEEVGDNISGWDENVHPEDKQRVASGIYGVINGGGNTWSDEYRFRRKDGSYAFVLDRGFIIHDNTGKAIRMLGSMMDITTRKKTEEAMLASEERYRIIFEQAADAIWLVDGDNGDMVEFNSRAHQSLGYSREEFAKLSIKDIDASQSTAEIKSHVKKILEQGSDGFETKHRKKDGEIRDVHVSCNAVWIRGRRLIQAIANDITERKRAEEKLKETMELKSQFISTVSHELRTPLTCIKGAVEAVLEGVAGQINDKQRHFLDIVKRNIERLSMLINDVLDFQRLESGRSKIDIKENDIREVVKSIDETMSLAAKQKGLNFAMELDGNLPRAWFDSNKIIQVLTNLIGNAIKFTPIGGSVTVSILRQGDEMLLRIRDTGMGIPKEDLPKIFDRFYRVPRPGKEIQGTGLGLSIVQKIVDLHRGRIEVESEPEKGTTFTIFMPLDARVPHEMLPEQADKIIETHLVNNSAKPQ